MGWHERLVVFALAVVLCADGIGASAAHATAPLMWAPPVHSGASGHSPSAITCPSVSLCVVLDGDGHVRSAAALVSGTLRDPGSIDRFPYLAALSCPSADACYGVGNTGDLYGGAVSTSASAWSPADIDMVNRLSGISCPSTSLCVAVDDAGNILTSTSPSATITWSLPTPIDGRHRIAAVSCPTASLCAAVDDSGNVLVSTTPTNIRSWQATPLAISAFVAVSCNRSALCAAVARNGDVYATADVATAQATWSVTPVDPRGSPTAVSCTDVGPCVVLDHGGNSFESASPAASPPDWAPMASDPAHATLTGVSCGADGPCVAAESTGRTVVASLPPPTVTTGTGVVASQTVVQLWANVNPNDTTVSACHFDYGTTPAYGAHVPCTVMPGVSHESQAVVGQIDGLRAATTYHFRIAASTGVASAAGHDAVFTTLPPLIAHPSLSGSPAVGATLTCRPNITTAAPETLAFAWLDDTAPIAGATAPQYRVTLADQTRHLSCRVTVAGDGGSASATSGSAAIPSQTTRKIIESSARRITSRRTSVSATVTCSPEAAGHCVLTLRLSAHRIVHHKRRRVLVGFLSTQIQAGTTRTLSVSLNATGRRLLRQRHRLAVTLKVDGTIIGTLTARLRIDKLIIRAKTSTRRHAVGMALAAAFRSARRWGPIMHLEPPGSIDFRTRTTASHQWGTGRSRPSQARAAARSRV